MDDDLDAVLALLARTRLLGRVCRELPLTQDEYAALGETIIETAEEASGRLAKLLSN